MWKECVCRASGQGERAALRAPGQCTREAQDRPSGLQKTGRRKTLALLRDRALRGPLGAIAASGAPRGQRGHVLARGRQPLLRAYWPWSSLARYFSGLAFNSCSQPMQQRNTSRPCTVTFTGVPIEPSGSPLTGQTFCCSAAARSSAESEANAAACSLWLACAVPCSVPEGRRTMSLRRGPRAPGSAGPGCRPASRPRTRLGPKETSFGPAKNGTVVGPLRHQMLCPRSARTTTSCGCSVY